LALPRFKEMDMKVLSLILALIGFLFFGTTASAFEVFPVKYEKVKFS